MFWASFVVFVLAPLAAGLFAVRRGLALWRDLKTALRSLGESADDVLARLEAIGAHEPADLGALDRSLDRLRRSRAQLAVLTNAIARAREQAPGALALYPRK